MTCPSCGNQKRGALCPHCGRAEGMPETRTPQPHRRKKQRRHDVAPTSSAAMPSPHVIEDQHRRIIACLQEHGEMTRAGIEEKTGIRINVVTPRVRELLDAGRLVEGRSVRNEGSRKLAKLVMLPHGPAYIEPQQALALGAEGAA